MDDLEDVFPTHCCAPEFDIMTHYSERSETLYARCSLAVSTPSSIILLLSRDWITAMLRLLRVKNMLTKRSIFVGRLSGASAVT